MENGSGVYRPGECNIDDTGVRARQRLGWICAISGAAVLISMFIMHAPPVGRFIAATFFSAAAVLNFRQASEHFCVVNGVLGRSEQEGKTSKIANNGFRVVDREKAIRDFMIAGALGLVIGSIGLLPF